MDMNFVVDNGKLKGDESSLFFQGEPVLHISETVDMLWLLVLLGAFDSKSQARKNWKGPVVVPDGFSDFKRIGKKRHRLTIFKPTDQNLR